MSNKHGSKWIRKPKRYAIYARDEWTCAYCQCHVVFRGAGNNAATLDHIIPRKHGGSNHASNLITACLSCNSARRETLLENFVDMGVIRRIKEQASRSLDIRNAKERMAA